MQKFKVIIVEDESLARQRLKKLLAPYGNLIEIVGEASNGAEGLELISSIKPDFIFLDIQMPVMNGFDMVLKLPYQPYIVFTTAFDEYAIKAFEENSIDYLLKPIKPERLELTIDKMKSVMKKDTGTPVSEDNLRTLLAQMMPEKKLVSITVHSGDKITIINLDDIAFFQAEDKMTVVYQPTGKKHLISQSLSQLEKKIPDHFMRINRSYIINENNIKEIRKGFNGKFVFYMNDTNDTKLTSGSTYTAVIRKRLKF